MTLAVARILDGQILVLSDTKVTFTTAGHRRAPHLVLKSVILTPDVCVAFAGDVDRAQMAIASVPLASGVEAMTDHFLAAHLDGDLATPDFILCALRPRPELIRIRDRGIERGLANAWVGNAKAFNELQRRALTSSETNPATALADAFHDLVHAEEFEDVGDFHVLCRSTRDGFMYTPQSGVSFWPDKSVTGPSWTPIGAGSATEGGYSWVMLAPRESGVGAIGVYFQQGRLGCLAYPRRSENLLRFPDVEISDFIADVRRRYGFTLWGLPALAM